MVRTIICVCYNRYIQKVEIDKNGKGRQYNSHEMQDNNKLAIVCYLHNGNEARLGEFSLAP